MLRDELIKTGDKLMTNTSTYLYVHPTHRVANRIGEPLSGWIIAVRQLHDPTFRDFVVKLDNGQEIYAAEYEFDIIGVDMKLRQRVIDPGHEWYQMEEFVEVDKRIPREVSFHTKFPLDLAEAFEKYSGLAVTYCNADNMLEIRI